MLVGTSTESHVGWCVYPDSNRGLYHVNVESNIPTSNVRAVSNGILGDCAEIIESEGGWFFTKCGKQNEGYPLGLGDDDVDKFATFLGFAPKRGGMYRYTFNHCGFSKLLSEWAEDNKSLAKKA